MKKFQRLSQVIAKRNRPSFPDELKHLRMHWHFSRCLFQLIGLQKTYFPIKLLFCTFFVEFKDFWHIVFVDLLFHHADLCFAFLSAGSMLGWWDHHRNTPGRKQLSRFGKLLLKKKFVKSCNVSIIGWCFSSFCAVLLPLVSFLHKICSSLG